MAKKRPTMQELTEAKNSERQEAMEAAIAEGRLIVRQMTPKERRESDARRAVLAEERAARAARPRFSR